MIFKAEQQRIPQVEPPKKTRKKQPPKGGRWTIVVLFGLTLLAIGIFYLKAEIPVLWQKITLPLVITSNQPPKTKFDSSLVLNAVADLTKDLRGEYGLYVYRFDDQNEYGLHQNESFPAASLMKLPVILRFYQAVEQGNLDPETQYILKENDKVLGAGILQGKASGASYTYRQLIEYMGQYSDNTAFKVIRQVLGDEKIQEAIDELGMAKTSLKEFETTPQDIGLFFQKLYQGKMINDEHSEELLKFLTKTAFEDWLPKGLPGNIKIVHKIGKDLGTFSDGGIVFANKPFVIVVMSKDAREVEANEILPKISGLVWEWEKSAASL
ncbi:MAG: class A beta-lactamase-related serine hydrolase [Candidatus Shapirobacteria bacterium]|nr:class A beta-lactamase-related serine hydrolase [Candidatus Shapirobacteria bacterium]